MTGDTQGRGADRRSVLLGAGAAVATGLLSGAPAQATTDVARRGPRTHPFTLGIASGDPLPTNRPRLTGGSVELQESAHRAA